MKKFFTKILKILLLVLFAILIDNGLGSLMEYFYFEQTSGRYSRLDFTVHHATDTIMIFGSSRANNNYIPTYFEEHLNASCYNSGTPGQQILYILAMQRMVLRRYKPQIMILNIDYYFLQKFDANYDRLADLLPYFKNHPCIADIIYMRGPYEKYKNYSRLYPYNSKIARMLLYYFTPQEDYEGYSPIYKKVIYPNEKLLEDKKNFTENKIEKVKNVPLDQNFVNAYDEFLYNAVSNNIKMLLVISPEFIPTDFYSSPSYKKIKELSDKYGLSIMDYSKNPQFLFNKELFSDMLHLNDNGAKLFSNILCDSLQVIYKK